MDTLVWVWVLCVERVCPPTGELGAGVRVLTERPGEVIYPPSMIPPMVDVEDDKDKDE